MPRFLMLAVVVAVVITVYAVVDCAMSEQRRIRVLPKPVWLVAILLLPVIGAICWILFGKGLIAFGGDAAQRGAGGPRTGGPAYGGQRAPDDDSEFLRGLRAGADAERRRQRDAQRPATPAADDDSGAEPGEPDEDGARPTRG